MLARVFSKIAVAGVALTAVLGGLAFSSGSAGALGSVSTFCNTTFSFPAEPHVGVNPTAAQERVLERYGLRVATLLHRYIALSPTPALAQEFALASNALREEVAILKNVVVLKERYVLHRSAATRAALIREAQAVVQKEGIYADAIGAINVLATQACAPATTTTTVPGSTTTVPAATSTTSTTTTTVAVTTTTQTA